MAIYVTARTVGLRVTRRFAQQAAARHATVLAAAWARTDGAHTHTHSTRRQLDLPDLCLSGHAGECPLDVGTDRVSTSPLSTSTPFRLASQVHGEPLGAEKTSGRRIGGWRLAGDTRTSWHAPGGGTAFLHALGCDPPWAQQDRTDGCLEPHRGAHLIPPARPDAGLRLSLSLRLRLPVAISASRRNILDVRPG